MKRIEWLLGFAIAGVILNVNAATSGSGGTPVPAAVYFVNPQPAVTPSGSSPVTFTGCTNQSPISLVAPSAPSCTVPASGVTVAQGTQQCLLGGSSPTCQVTINGSTVNINGGFGPGGGGGGGGAGSRAITIVNNSATNPIPVFMGVNGGAAGLQNLNTCYTITSTPACNFNLANPEICQFQGGVSTGTPLTVTFTPIPNAPASCATSAGQISIAFSAINQPWGTSPASLAEFTLNGIIGGVPQDTIDVSLVAGMNEIVNITGSSNNFAINMLQATPPSYNGVAGIYPLGCGNCASPPTNCQGGAQCTCQGGTQNNPSPFCQISRTQVTDTYTVTFSDVSEKMKK